MSVIRKIPYIESVISALSEANLGTLQTIINNGSAGTSASMSNLPSGVVAVHFTMPSGRIVDGILINKSTLIGYDGTQRIRLFKLADGLISEVYEYCDINELRRIVFDVGNAGGFVNPMTSAGDLIVGGTDGEATRLGIGTQGQVLKVGSSGLEWASDNDGMANPMTTSQDLIVGGTDGTPTRLAKGSNGYLFGVDGSGNLAYGNSLPILTTAPSSANTDGGIKIVVLTSEPATKYDGYLYIIKEV